MRMDVAEALSPEYSCQLLTVLEEKRMEVRAQNTANRRKILFGLRPPPVRHYFRGGTHMAGAETPEAFRSYLPDFLKLALNLN